MSSVMGVPYQAAASPMYSTDFIQDEMSRQLALSDSMRLASRGSTGQRTQSAMRVVKPSSASNSPQNMMARRRTLVNDGNLAKRRQQALEYALAQQMQGPSPPYSSYQEPVKRADLASAAAVAGTPADAPAHPAAGLLTIRVPSTNALHPGGHVRQLHESPTNSRRLLRTGIAGQLVLAPIIPLHGAVPDTGTASVRLPGRVGGPAADQSEPLFGAAQPDSQRVLLVGIDRPELLQPGYVEQYADGESLHGAADAR